MLGMTMRTTSKKQKRARRQTTPTLNLTLTLTDVEEGPRWPRNGHKLGFASFVALSCQCHELSSFFVYNLEKYIIIILFALRQLQVIPLNILLNFTIHDANAIDIYIYTLRRLLSVLYQSNVSSNTTSFYLFGCGRFNVDVKLCPTSETQNHLRFSL